MMCRDTQLPTKLYIVGSLHRSVCKQLMPQHSMSLCLFIEV